MLKQVPYIKCHGSGNDFVLIAERKMGVGLSEEQRKLLAIGVCDRSTGIGADGLIFFEESQVADAKTRVFNADGSEAELCGNGMRCVARYGCELFNKPELNIETIKAIYKVRREKSIFGDIPSYSVQIDTVSLKLNEIPVKAPGETLLNQSVPGFYDQLKFSAVSLTNPHLISIVDQIDMGLLEEVGKSANSNKKIFPRGINVSFCRILGDRTIQVETYERGVGHTYSCGTAMSSSTLVYCLLNPKYFGQFVDVLNGGGMVRCMAQRSVAGKYSINLSGNATFVYKSRFDYDFAHPGVKNPGDEIKIDEEAGYAGLLDYSKQKLVGLAAPVFEAKE